MKIQTEQFGKLELEDNRLLTFERGIPGFEQETNFVLLPADPAGDSPFFFLQSTEHAAISFFMADPFVFLPDYEVKLDDTLTGQLKLDDPSDAIVLVTVTPNKQIGDATANLKAPVVINNKQQLGKQIVLNNSNYQVKHPLFQQAARQV